MSLVASPNIIQDRTLEFKQSVTNFNRINRDKVKSKSQPVVSVSKSEFSSRASTIAKDIAHASNLLGKLALLAKRKPLFDDRPTEIAELTYVIKQDIFKIQKQLKDLQEFQRTGQISGSNKSQISTYSQNVLKILNTKTKNVSGEFKDVLEIRQKNEMESKERKNQFLSATSALTEQNPLLGANQPAQLGNENPFLAALSSDDPDASVPGDSPYLSFPEQTQQMALLEEQSSEYLQERNRAVETIESTINEVGNLFQQLATMVNEQGETVRIIDNNVDDIEMNIQGAQHELLKYFNNYSNNRWLYLKIFGVLIFFFLLWVLVS